MGFLMAASIGLAVSGGGVAWGSNSAGRHARRHGTPPRRGGSLTVLEGAGYVGNWPGLDPATDTVGPANETYMDAIFGQLFDLGPGGKMLPDLATGYSYSNGGKTVTVDLRSGVKFSDGTPFNSEAVKFNWERDLSNPCTCKPQFLQKAPPVIRTVGPYKIAITFQYVGAAFIDLLQDENFSWIASPSALKRMGERAFELKPVGAGPFEVVSDTPSSALVLKRNPHYFMKGLPYLDTLTFRSVANDEAALEAMRAGSAQAYEGMSTPQLVPSFKAGFNVTTEPSTSPYDLQFNTAIPPFNNLKAREAVYEAIDCPLLDKKLFGGQEPCGESFEAPAGLFYERKVPGYPTYDPAKARALVKSLGGLDVSFLTIAAPTALSLMEGIQTELQAVGMKVSLHQNDISTLIGDFTGGKWELALLTCGAYDPAQLLGPGLRFSSNGLFSGVHDPRLDALINAAAETTNPRRRHTLYNSVAAYMAKHAYGVFLFPINGYDVADHGVSAPGLTTPIPAVDVVSEVLWQYASAGTK